MINIKVIAKDEYKEVAALLKTVFPQDELFKQGQKRTINYMENADGTFYVVEDNDIIVGAMLLSAKKNKGFTLWTIQHAAILPNRRGTGIGIILIQYVDQMIRTQIKEGKFKSAKIEMKISGKDKIFAEKSEKNDVSFLKRNGFKIEGELKDHFKKGETCFILGKSFS